MQFSLAKVVMLAASVGMVSATALRPRDTTYPACDATQSVEDSKVGQCHAWEMSKPGSVEYLAPGTGACNIPYTDDSHVVCLNPGWLSAAKNGSNCGKSVELKYDGKCIKAQIADSCPGADCNGLFVSKSIFKHFGGKKALGTGHLPDSIEWKILDF